jgi:signal peptidase I
MRPTYREGDHLLVNKTSFGINVPLRASHLLFDPDQVERTGVVVFTGHNLPLSNNDDLYFWLFPFKKRYIKRLLGKPGDSLYFYGGRIYGIDAEGKEVRELLESPLMQNLEHIPFIRFEGEVKTVGTPYLPRFELSHFQVPLAQIEAGNSRQLRADLLSDKGFGTAFGIDHYGMARLLTAEEVRTFTDHSVPDDSEAELYLEIRHHPNPEGSKVFVDERAGYHLQLGTESTLLPMHARHLEALMAQMYTNRFWISDAYALPFYAGRSSAGEFARPQQLLVSVQGVEEGLYEFYHGRLSRVGIKGWSSDIAPSESLLYSSDPSNVQMLFNFGVEWLKRVQPSSSALQNYPSRYVYFRDGALYLLGSEVFAADDPVLQRFVSRELRKAENGNYRAFVDRGAPILADGSFDKEKILRYGLTVPERHYLCLGDNHASSADGRIFGFVPEDNLRGTPQLLLWPPGERWGLVGRPEGTWINLPTLMIWGPLLLAAWIGYVIHQRRLRQPAFTKLD